MPNNSAIADFVNPPASKRRGELYARIEELARLEARRSSKEALETAYVTLLRSQLSYLSLITLEHYVGTMEAEEERWGEK